MSALEILVAVVLFCVAGVGLALLALPMIIAFSLVAAVAKVAIFLLVLPLRIIGLTVGLGFTAAGFMLKGVFLTGVIALLILVGLLPLLPLILFGVLVYFLVRA